MSKVLKIISFRETALFKRGVILSAAALIASAAAPAIHGGTWSSLAPTLAAGGLMLVVSLLFIHRTRIHRLADEVMDCEDHLKVRRGKTEFAVPMSAISAVEISSAGGVHRITVRLRSRGEAGGTIDFLPQASLWSNRTALGALAEDLKARARQSNFRDPMD